MKADYSAEWGLAKPPGLVASVAHARRPASYRVMDDKEKDAELDDSSVVWDDEDEETLAAIDEGIREIEAAKGISIEEVRKRFRNRR